MLSLLVTFLSMLINYGQAALPDGLLTSVETNSKDACLTTGFDGFRVKENVEGLMKFVETAGFDEFAAYYSFNAAHETHSTHPTTSLDVEKMKKKATVDKLFKYVNALRRNIVDRPFLNHDCDPNEITKHMQQYFNKNVKGKESKACIIGTNFRFVDHMHRFMRWLSSGAIFHKSVRGKYHTIFSAFIPGLDNCWEYDVSVIYPIVVAMHGVAIELAKSWTDDFFEISTLKKDDIVKYLPHEEKECIRNPAEVIGPHAFHAVVTFIKNNDITAEGIFRESTPSALNYLKKKIIFAVVRNSNEIGELLQQLLAEGEKDIKAVHVLPSVLKAILSALSMPFPSIHSGMDATSKMLHMLGDTHGDHVCIQTMFIEVLQLGQAALAHAASNRVSSGCLSTTLVGNMFFRTFENTNGILKFGKVLMDTFNFDQIKKHFWDLLRDQHEVNAGQQKASMQDSGLPPKLKLSKSEIKLKTAHN